MGIELVVFDLAGTTVKDNKDVHRVLQSALAKHHVDVSIEDANKVMGIPKPVAINTLLKLRSTLDKQITDTWINAIHHDFVEEMIAFYRTDISVGEKEGVSETFKRLKANSIKVAVDTGFDRPITDEVLKRMGWIANKLIDASVTSDEVPNGRPHPDLIFKAMALTGIKDVKKVAKVGDTASDLAEGTSAGCGLVIGVTSGAFSREQLQAEKHTHLIENVAEILQILNIQ